MERLRTSGTLVERMTLWKPRRLRSVSSHSCCILCGCGCGWVCVCACVCVGVCVGGCECVYVWVCVCVCEWVSVRERACVCSRLSTWVCVWVCNLRACARVYLSGCVYVRVCKCICLPKRLLQTRAIIVLAGRNSNKTRLSCHGYRTTWDIYVRRIRFSKVWVTILWSTELYANEVF